MKLEVVQEKVEDSKRGNQTPSFEEEHTMQWQKDRRHKKDKPTLIDRVQHTKLKIEQHEQLRTCVM